MGRVARHCAGNLLLLICLFTLTFLMVEGLPGDPALVRAGERADAATLENIRREYGLDQPAAVRYVRQLVKIVVLFEPGQSLRTRRSVREDLADALPATVELALTALFMASALGIPLGVLAARLRGRWPDLVLTQLALTGVSIPVFVLGYLMILGFGGADGLPFAGRMDASLVGDTTRSFVLFGALFEGDWPAARDAFRHLVLPALTLATIPLAIILRLTRGAMIEQLGEDYLRTARAKGVGEARALTRHALRVASPAIVTVIALQAGLLLSGAVLTEGIFSWPGMGKYLIESLRSQDAPALQGCILLFGVLFITVNILADFACSLMDPRWRDAV